MASLHLKVQQAVPFFYIKKQLRVLVRGLSRWCRCRRCWWCWGWISEADFDRWDKKNWFTFFPWSMSNVQKSSNTIFKHIPRKDHFFGSVLSHTNESSGSICFAFNWFSVFIKTTRGEQERVGLFHPCFLRPETDPSTTWSRNPWWPMWTAARRISMTSSVGCGSFTANGTILGGWKTGIFLGEDFFFPPGKERYIWFPKKNNVEWKRRWKFQMDHSKNECFFSCVMLPSWTFFWHTADPLASWWSFVSQMLWIRSQPFCEFAGWWVVCQQSDTCLQCCLALNNTYIGSSGFPKFPFEHGRMGMGFCWALHCPNVKKTVVSWCGPTKVPQLDQPTLHFDTLSFHPSPFWSHHHQTTLVNRNPKRREKNLRRFARTGMKWLPVPKKGRAKGERFQPKKCAERRQVSLEWLNDRIMSQSQPGKQWQTWGWRIRDTLHNLQPCDTVDGKDPAKQLRLVVLSHYLPRF